MIMNKWSIILTLLLLVSALIAPTSALVVSLDKNQFEEYSDLIIKGTVIGNTSSQWSTEDGNYSTDRYNNPNQRLFYDYIVEVDDVYKGELSDNAESKVYVRYFVGLSTQIELETEQKYILYLVSNENNETYEFGPKGYRLLSRTLITEEPAKDDSTIPGFGLLYAIVAVTCLVGIGAYLKKDDKC